MNRRAELIEAIQKVGRMYDATAQQDAIELARRPNDKERAAKAQVSVAMADMSVNAAAEVAKQPKRKQRAAAKAAKEKKPRKPREKKPKPTGTFGKWDSLAEKVETIVGQLIREVDVIAEATGGQSVRSREMLTSMQSLKDLFGKVKAKAAQWKGAVR